MEFRSFSFEFILLHINLLIIHSGQSCRWWNILAKVVFQQDSRDKEQYQVDIINGPLLFSLWSVTDESFLNILDL